MNLFRWPFDIFWEDCVMAGGIAVVAGYYFESQTFGYGIGMLGFFILIFRWASLFSDASPAEASYEEKIRHRYAASCAFASTLSANFGLFCGVNVVARLTPTVLPEVLPYMWLRPWVVTFIMVGAIARTIFHYRVISRSIMNPNEIEL